MVSTLLITGAGGQLGSVLMQRAARARPEYSSVGIVSPNGPRPFSGRTNPCDLSECDAVASLIRTIRPSAIIHTAAMTNVSGCYRNALQAEQLNAVATQTLVELADELGARIALTSTDLVFDGLAGNYDEYATAHPLSVYGRTKLASERHVNAYRRGIVVRLPLMYGVPHADRPTTFLMQVKALRDGRPLTLFHDEFRSPLALDDAADALLTVVSSDAVGILHAGGPERLSRLQMGELTAAALGIAAPTIVSASQTDVAFDEPRPADVSLVSDRFAALFGRPPGRRMADALPDIVAAFHKGLNR